jgi:multidrug efflux pump subunit AcrB
MTALAMVLGMLPMAIEPSQNSPLGRAVIGGLIFATCATLFLVPTLFSVVHGQAARPATRTASPLDSLHPLSDPA